ncbi:MAG: GIY-YIG nuclease family protein [Gemmataceae bacterium]
MSEIAPPPQWSVYLLRCADGTFYVGISTDCARRVQQHNAGTASRYTRLQRRRPVQLVYQEPCENHGAALRREYALKQLSRSEKQALVDSFAAIISRVGQNFPA